MIHARILIAAIPLFAVAQLPPVNGPAPLHLVSSLPENERRQILVAVETAVWNTSSDIDDADTMQDKVLSFEHDLQFQRLGIGEKQLTFLRASGQFCGASGNCSMMILNHENHVVLDHAVAQQWRVLPTLHHAMPDVQFSLHDSASRADQHLYAFDGKKYQLDRCATDRFGDDGKWSSESIPCNP